MAHDPAAARHGSGGVRKAWQLPKIFCLVAARVEGAGGTGAWSACERICSWIFAVSQACAYGQKQMKDLAPKGDRVSLFARNPDSYSIRCTEVFSLRSHQDFPLLCLMALPISGS